jgi:hypothetical protein
MRKIFSALVLILGLAVAPAAAHATPVTYDLTFTSFGGILGGNVSGGTGTLTLDSAPGAGIDIFSEPGFAGNSITDLTINIGKDVFTLADATIPTFATFINGDLESLLYASLKKVTFHFESGLLYYNFRDGRDSSNGYLTATLATVPTSPAPEPSSLLLFGTGALAFGMGIRKFAA